MKNSGRTFFQKNLHLINDLLTKEKNAKKLANFNDSTIFLSEFSIGTQETNSMIGIRPSILDSFLQASYFSDLQNEITVFPCQAEVITKCLYNINNLCRLKIHLKLTSKTKTFSYPSRMRSHSLSFHETSLKCLKGAWMSSLLRKIQQKSMPMS